MRLAGNTKGGRITLPLTSCFDWFGISCMSTDNFYFYLQNRLIQTSHTGGQRYNDTSPFSIPWPMFVLTRSTGLKLILQYYWSSALYYKHTIIINEDSSHSKWHSLSVPSLILKVNRAYVATATNLIGRRRTTTQSRIFQRRRRLRRRRRQIHRLTSLDALAAPECGRVRCLRRTFVSGRRKAGILRLRRRRRRRTLRARYRLYRRTEQGQF